MMAFISARGPSIIDSEEAEIVALLGVVQTQWPIHWPSTLDM